MWSSLETTPKIITVAGNFVFITLSKLNCPDLHFEGAGNGFVVITWIDRRMSCTAAHLRSRSLNIVTFIHDRRFPSLLGLYTTGQLVGLQKKKNRFSLNGNGIMSFLGQKFYRSTLYIGNEFMLNRLSKLSVNFYFSELIMKIVLRKKSCFTLLSNLSIAMSAGAVEYTDCFSAEG